MDGLGNGIKPQLVIKRHQSVKSFRENNTLQEREDVTEN
jgi:hypothetical protein